MSKIEQELLTVIKENNMELSIFINKKLNSKLFRKRNKQELIRLLPIIMENTNDNNSFWLYADNNISFYNNKDFLDTFIDNIDKLSTEKLLSKSFANILKIFELNEEQLKKLTDNLLKCEYKPIGELFYLLLKKDEKLAEYMLKKYITYENKCSSCIRIIKHHKEFLPILYENIDFILENIPNLDLYDLKQYTVKDETILEKINQKISKTKKESITTTIKNLYNRFLDKDSLKIEQHNQEKLQTILEVVYLIIEDVCKNENIDISKIKILGGGTFSTALAIGDKVVKIGCTRGTKTFPNNPYIVSSILRKEFPIDEKISLYVEVTEKVDTNTEINQEEIYQLYKKLRDINVIWTDVAVRNVGRLLKDNQVHWRQELPITDEVLGLQEYVGNEQLKKGQIVILDNDLIYKDTEDEKIIRKYSNQLQEEFEKRYQEEKRIAITPTENIIEEKHKTR